MLSIHGLHKQYGGKILFEDAQAHLNHRSKVALIGPNGAGKSTLIKMVLGLESPDEGQIAKVPRLSIGYLSQEVPQFTGRTVLAEVMSLDGRRESLLAARADYEKKFSDSQTSSSIAQSELDHYGRILEEIEHLDEYRLESRAKTILNGMGFSNADFDRSLTEFSGGWLMRVALSRILLMEPDLLLLDEPTNHLDLESLLWLEGFLCDFQGAVLLISHDTAFLNRIVREVWEVDQKKLWSYQGNLDSYRLQKEERLAILRAQYQGQQEKIAEIEAFVARFGAKATKARQAQSRLKVLEKMELVELPEEQASMKFRFPPAPPSGREVVTVQNAGVSFGNKKVLSDLNWIIQRGMRTAIVGVNGAGKTTLLKMLAQTLAPTSGMVKLGHNVHVGYYAQMQAESIDPTRTILEELESVAPEMPTAQVRAVAGSFLFTGDAVQKKCSVLSGGEKARVALAKLLLSPSNFLILDEPTNHLDVGSRSMLLHALQGYEGTLCMVSHDRDFMSPLVNSVLEIIPSPKGSKVIHLVEGYEDYLKRKQQEISSVRVTAEKPQKASPLPLSHAEAQVRNKPSNNQRRSWERERDQLEKEIARLEQERAQLHELLGDSSTYADAQKTMTLVEQQKIVEEKLNADLSKWEDLCMRLERL